jgi:hypothetical protein
MLGALNNTKVMAPLVVAPGWAHAKRVSRVEVEAILIHNAMLEAEEILAATGTSVAVASSRTEIAHEVEQLVHASKPNELHTGKRFFEIKERRDGAALQRVRRAADEWIYMANLPQADVLQLQVGWEKTWDSASSPLALIEGYPVWRCGGSAYCLGPAELDQRIVRLRTE